VRVFKTKSITVTKETEPKSSGASNEEVCSVHCKAISHWCFKCQLWICVECLESHSSLLGCTTAIETNAMENIKEKTCNDMDVLLSIFEDDAKFVSTKIQESTQKRKEILEKAETYGQEVKTLCSLLEQGNLQKDKLVEMKKQINSANSLHAVSVRLKEVAQRKQLLRNWSVKTLGTDTPLGLLKTLKEEKYVYAEKIIKNETWHAKLSHHEENIHYHSFQKQAVEGGCIIMPFERIQKIIPEETSLVFIEFTLARTVKGRVLLRLEKNLANIREHIVQLVTGKQGPSFVGTNFSNDGTLGLYQNGLPFSEIKFKGDKSGRSKGKKGDVIGYFVNGYLQHIRFYVAPPPTTYDFGSEYCVFGHIEKGINIIQECCGSCSNGVSISDCGIVLEEE
ncbi:unnamed protein product, partial [Meganyctiphanes norvegica]